MKRIYLYALLFGSLALALQPQYTSAQSTGAPLAAQPVGPTKVITGQDALYTCSATDPDGDSITIQIQWGDGSSNGEGPVPSGSTAYFGHRWSAVNIYRIFCHVRDSSGNVSASPPLEVTVVAPQPNRPPVARRPVGPKVVVAGEFASYSASAADPDGDRITIRIQWGDRSSNGEGPLESGSTAYMAHAWSRPGTYQVRTEAIDAHGAKSVSTSLVVTVVPGTNSTAGAR